jgi:ribosomal protein S14
MKKSIFKDRRCRIIHAYFECRRKVLLALFQNLALSPKIRREAYKNLIYLPLSSSITKIRNHCSITGRSRAIYRRFGLSRLIFRKLA